MPRISALLALLALLPALIAPARGDDWPQFRHDSTRSATSKDSLQFPLKELWTWKTVGTDGHHPLYHAVIRKGLVYFTASDKNGRHLICADAKTGAVRWRHQLEAERLAFDISDIAGPALSDAGVVFVYDWISTLDRTLIGPLEKALNAHFCTVDSFVVRTFDAATGQEGYYFPMAAMGINGILPRLSLMETQSGQKTQFGQAILPVPPTMAGTPP
ncbi:MAG TPA: hypothetical protein VKU00_05095 [Chthonomonadaceae bacterium]|nr:hypothetical protein [Chthonomonadaceae bacterium]